MGLRYIYDSDIVDELRRFDKEKDESIKDKPNRLWHIKAAFANRAFLLLLEHKKL